jgi:hypothetical protein
MTADEPPSSWAVLFRRVGHLSGAGQRFKLVSEESELPRVGCVEAWQQRRTTIFLILCWCLVVGVVVFSLAMCGPVLRSRSCLFLGPSSATITLDMLSRMFVHSVVGGEYCAVLMLQSNRRVEFKWYRRVGVLIQPHIVLSGPDSSLLLIY